MRKILYLLFILIPFLGNAQIIDSFDDNEFSSNPEWYGEISKFEVINPPTSGDGSLNASANNDGKVLRSKQNQGDAVLTTANPTAYGEWRFSIADGTNWAVSSTNDYIIVLMSNDSTVSKLKDGAKNFNGYFFRFKGSSANDDFGLFKQTGNTETEILNTSYPGTVDGNTAIGRSVKITRSDIGEWRIYIDDGFDVIASTQRGSMVLDNTHTTSNWFGISTNIANPGLTRVLYFDNLYIGPIVGDTIKPVVSSVSILSSSSLRVVFNEAVSEASAENINNYLVNNSIGNPDSAVLNLGNQTTVDLYFTNQFADGILNTLTISSVEDISGNAMNSSQHNFTYNKIKALSTTALSSNQLSVVFSETVETISAKTISNYSVNNSIGNPDSVTINTDNKSVILYFANNFISGTNYTLTVQNVTDLIGTSINTTNLPFSYFVVQQFDIVINEIMADPTPVVGLPDAEYVELYNTTSYDVDLNGWTITTGTTVKSIPTTTIPANGYILICTTTAQSLLQQYGTALGVLSTYALTNSGATIKIKNNNGLTIDSVSYLDSWYLDAGKKDGGWSLEKIDPLNNCSGSGNWIASVHPSGGTPGSVNSVKNQNQDIFPPYITNLLVTDSNRLSIQYSENINSSLASIKTNYSVNNGIGNPDSVSVILNTVNLYFSTAFTEGITNTLTINSISDLCNNTLLNSQKEFSYYTIHQYDIVINEIMADPSPVVALPNWEYLELYNRTNHSIDLINWTITIGSTSKVIPNIQIGANAYLLICSSYAYNEVSLYGNTVAIYNLPALVNSGQSITIKDGIGNIISSVTYSDSWYGDATKKEGGWSLEAIDPNNTCGGVNNWKASIDERGGTPGSVNSILANNIDTIAPKVNFVLVYREKILLVSFTEIINSTSATNISNYIVPGYNIDSVKIDSTNKANVYIYFNSAFALGVENILTIQNISDECGNLLNISSIPFTFNKVFPYDVLINEVMADPDPVIGLPNYEYIELHNKTNNKVDMIGWTITSGTTTKTIPSTQITAGGYLILCHSNYYSNFTQFGNVAAIASFPSLSNTGQSITIKDYNGSVIHSISYTDKWYQDKYKDDGGWSLELIDVNNPCGGIKNWIASTDPLGGTPGKKNSVYGTNPDITAPSVLRAYIQNDTLNVIFDEPLKFSSINNKNIYSVDNGIGNPAWIQPVEPRYLTVKMKFTQSFSKGTIYTISVMDSIMDCAGNKVAEYNSCRFAIPDSAVAKDVIINEVLYDPKGDGADFVELYNRSEKTIDLKNLKLTNRKGASLSDNIKTITTDGYLLFPEEFVVLTTSIENIQTTYYTPNKRAFVEMTSMPTYSNDTGDVVLVDKWVNLIDDMSYSSDMQFPLLVTVDGVTLERISYERDSKDILNWHSASEIVGFATPAYKNSQHSEAIASNANLSISPDIFSPDNDGYNDNLNITYKFNKPGYSTSISLYNSKGILVRKLIQNQMLGIEGTISWDGLSDAREKAPIGIYIIYLEAFDLDGDIIKIKKPCVVATKL